MSGNKRRQTFNADADIPSGKIYATGELIKFADDVKIVTFREGYGKVNKFSNKSIINHLKKNGVWLENPELGTHAVYGRDYWFVEDGLSIKQELDNIASGVQVQFDAHYGTNEGDSFLSSIPKVLGQTKTDIGNVVDDVKKSVEKGKSPFIALAAAGIAVVLLGELILVFK